MVSKLRAMASATRLLATFLQHYKGARLSFAEISQRTASLADRKRAEAFLAVFRPVFERYREPLARSGTIDFHDMINRATDFVLRNPAQIRKTVRSDAQGGPPSSFARELMHGRYDVNVFGRLLQADVPCPQCKEGRLERRENPRSGSTFYGCSNRPYRRSRRPVRHACTRRPGLCRHVPCFPAR